MLYINSYSYIEKMNVSIKYITTSYCAILDTDSQFDTEYSSIFINYLNNTPTCDIAVSNFKKINTSSKTNTEYIYKSLLIFSKDTKTIPYTGVVWRKNIHSFLNNLEEIDDDINFWKYCIESNLNIRCVSNKILYSINN